MATLDNTCIGQACSGREVRTCTAGAADAGDFAVDGDRIERIATGAPEDGAVIAGFGRGRQVDADAAGAVALTIASALAACAAGNQSMVGNCGATVILHAIAAVSSEAGLIHLSA